MLLESLNIPLNRFEDVDSQKFFKLKGETSSTRGHALKGIVSDSNNIIL